MTLIIEDEKIKELIQSDDNRELDTLMAFKVITQDQIDAVRCKMESDETKQEIKKEHQKYTLEASKQFLIDHGYTILTNMQSKTIISIEDHDSIVKKVRFESLIRGAWYGFWILFWAAIFLSCMFPNKENQIRFEQYQNTINKLHGIKIALTNLDSIKNYHLDVYMIITELQDLVNSTKHMQDTIGYKPKATKA